MATTDQLAGNLCGQWTGFANGGTPDNRRRMDLLLQLRGKRLSGVGDDESGIFVMTGEYDPDAQEFRWEQIYLDGDTLHCRGFHDHNGIWGTWQNAAGDSHGGFHFWPLKRSDQASPAAPNRLTTVSSEPQAGR